MKMKMVSLIALVLIIVVASAVIISVVIVNQRENDNVLAQVVVWPDGGGVSRGLPIYYFVIKNDGTLIGYYGRSRRGVDHDRTRNFVRSIQEREQIDLNEDDFLHISELVGRIVLGSDDLEGYFGSSHVMFLRNGYFYENCSFRSVSLQNLLRTLSRLTSLSSSGW